MIFKRKKDKSQEAILATIDEMRGEVARIQADIIVSEKKHERLIDDYEILLAGAYSMRDDAVVELEILKAVTISKMPYRVVLNQSDDEYKLIAAELRKDKYYILKTFRIGTVELWVRDQNP